MAALLPIRVSERMFRKVRRATRAAPLEAHGHGPPLWVVFDRAVIAALDRADREAPPPWLAKLLAATTDLAPVMEVASLAEDCSLMAEARALRDIEAAALAGDAEDAIAASDELAAIQGF